MLLSATFALVWSYSQSSGGKVADMGWTALFFALFIISNTVLFSTVMWSKFAHMFFKPAAALQKRVSEADGSRNKLPAPADKPEVFGSARELPRHY